MLATNFGKEGIPLKRMAVVVDLTSTRISYTCLWHSKDLCVDEGSDINQMPAQLDRLHCLRYTRAGCKDPGPWPGAMDFSKPPVHLSHFILLFERCIVTRTYIPL